MSIEDLDPTPGHRIARSGPVIIIYIARPVIVEDIKRWVKVIDEHRATYPRYSTLTVMAPKLTLSFNSEVRAELSKSSQITDGLAGGALVVREKGIGVTVHRLFIAFFSLVQSSPFRMFADLPQAIEWLGTLEAQSDARHLSASQILRHFGEAP